jgi:uncharacterized protein YegP (UPF0339 family)
MRAAGAFVAKLQRERLMAGKFEIFQDRGAFRFRLTDDHDVVLGASGPFGTKADAAKAIMAVRENAAAGHIVDTTAQPVGRSPRATSRKAEYATS